MDWEIEIKEGWRDNKRQGESKSGKKKNGKRNGECGGKGSPGLIAALG